MDDEDKEEMQEMIEHALFIARLNTKKFHGATPVIIDQDNDRRERISERMKGIRRIGRL